MGRLLGICPFSSLDPEAEPGELPYVPLLPGGAWSSQPQPLEPRLGGPENGNGGCWLPPSWSGTLVPEGSCSHSMKRVTEAQKRGLPRCIQVGSGRTRAGLGYRFPGLPPRRPLAVSPGTGQACAGVAGVWEGEGQACLGPGGSTPPSLSQCARAVLHGPCPASCQGAGLNSGPGVQFAHP